VIARGHVYTLKYAKVYAKVSAEQIAVTNFLVVVVKNGIVKSSKILEHFNKVAKEQKFSVGLKYFLESRGKFMNKTIYEEQHSMTSSAILDPILEQILSYIIRDFINSWYVQFSNDFLFQESIKRTIRRTVAAFTQCARKVDYVPLLTQHMVDDFASHMRLYRKAKERAYELHGEVYTNEELETIFFDLELDMEKNYCRDLVSTSSHYENAYLHDVTDILMYLLMPGEDFRSRPLRFLLREIIVQRVFIPVLDMFSDPDYINHAIVLLLSETSLKTEDFITVTEGSNDIQELEAILEALLDERNTLRAKDFGGEQSAQVKSQLASVDYVENMIKRRMEFLAIAPSTGVDLLSMPQCSETDNDRIVQLPIHVVLSNNIVVMYFADYLSSVGGQNLIDCYLAIEGFKVSVDHQLRGLAVGETIESDVYETIKEAANFLYQQYLSQASVTRVPIDEASVNKFLSRMRNDEPPDIWFEHIQDRIIEILKTDEKFYPAFKKDPIYYKMLFDLGIMSKESEAEGQTSTSRDLMLRNSQNGGKQEVIILIGEIEEKQAAGTHIVIETLGIGQQGKQIFALYNVRVKRVDTNGKTVSGWNVLRRYSDFHTLHSVICAKACSDFTPLTYLLYPNLSNLSFPGKKTFNNLDPDFLEKRTRALNVYMTNVLKPSVLEASPNLENIIFNFLSQKDYVGEREALPKKIVSAVFDPIRSGMRAFGNAVNAVPDSVYFGVSKMGDGLNKAAKQMIGSSQNISSLSSDSSIDSSRVAAVYNDQQWMESIPLRVLVLLIDEIFDVRTRSTWFRRRLIALLRQFIDAAMGSSINRRIIDLVQWLTSEQQVAQYIIALRDSLWPDGHLNEFVEERSQAVKLRTRLLSRALLLGALPDELRLFIGSSTTLTGITNVSEALQNRRMNRRLLYVLLERFLFTLFPENRFDKVFPLLHSKSPRAHRG
uniref:Sorting nexin-13 n=1 Tax=Syphacia muris TaxID=451379 RepID=A0A0N5AAU0_9BILA